VTTRLGGGRGVFYGPFRSRVAAERFESEFLDLFQIRRCQEDFEPSPDHPGCIYGEMNRCLRPCQQVVGIDEYQSEVERVGQFLSTRGESLLRSVASARDRLSEEMDFEEAARQHARFERIQQVLRASDELADDIDRLWGVAVTPAAQPAVVTLWFFVAGFWQPPERFELSAPEGKPVSLDRRLREIVAAIEPQRLTIAERQEHLALLARWHYSTWRDGEWLGFSSFDALPYRKLVNAIHRAATVTA
jgi:excinuclease UvrABC nuclease subunit